MPKDAEAIAEALISHPAVRRVNFTGSTRVGTLLAQIAAKHLKPILLELGGKAPLVVLGDADVDAAVDATVFGAFANAGQICMSTERVIVDETIADEFAGKLARRVAALPSGDPNAGEFVIGSLVGKSAVERMQRLVADAVAKGARVLTGGESDGTVMKGIVVDRVTPDDAAVPRRVVRAAGLDHPCEVGRRGGRSSRTTRSTDCPPRCSAGIWRARSMWPGASSQESVTSMARPFTTRAQMPFGGVKGSGYGRFGGKAAIDEFTELRWITVQTGPRHYPF